MKKFTASMDANTRILTWFICFIIAASVLSLFLTLGGHPAKSYTARWITIAVIGSLATAYFLRPLGYSIGNGKLIIQKGMGRKEIECSGISEVREVNKNDWGKGIRTFGAGGFFGYFSKLHFSKLGNVTAYVTNPRKTILITTKARQQYLISSDDTQGFMNKIHEELPVLHPFTPTKIIHNDR